MLTESGSTDAKASQKEPALSRAERLLEQAFTPCLDPDHSGEVVLGDCGEHDVDVEFHASVCRPSAQGATRAEF